VEGDLRDASGTWGPVTGQAWMDHQWGNFVIANAGGWDWFSLQLDDSTELMLYVLRGPDGQQSAVYGSQVLPDGNVRDLQTGDVNVQVLDHWTSPHTGGVYPSSWQVEIPAQQVRLRVTPRLADQELYFPGDQFRGPIYWEGAVQVDGESGSAGGVGYVELTGYAPT
jgi:predicted secreted hydrolase